MELPVIKPIFMPTGKPMSVAVFLSGTGTNFIAIYDEIKRLHSSAIDCGVTIDIVFTNAPNCKGAQRAGEYGIPVLSLSSKRFLGVLDKDPDDEDAREYYDAAVIALLESVCEPDIIVLAGYRRRLGSLFLKRYADSVINLDPETRGGDSPDGRKVKGTIHWVSANHAITTEVRLYDRLFSVEEPEANNEGKPFTDYINPDSFTVLKDCYLEPSLQNAVPGAIYQFERLGYFIADQVDSTKGAPVFNRTVTLRDAWSKKNKK